MLDCSLERMHIAIRDVMECRFAIRYIGGACSLGDSGLMVPVKFVFDVRAIIPIMIMFICGIDR